jgi:hypothetical protein
MHPAIVHQAVDVDLLAALPADLRDEFGPPARVVI